jgi:D-amino-acid oxidase
VSVVGAGVLGLSCALRLLETGAQVRVIADRPPPRTTSAVAAALWYPYLAAPMDRVGPWAARTYEVFGELAAVTPSVRLLPGRELLGVPTPDPPWAAAVPDLRRLATEERAGHPDGWAFTAPVVDMPRYLDWLLDRFVARGGRLEERHVASLAAEAADCDELVNCAGLGARELVADAGVRPVRGQVVLVRNPGLEQWLLDETDPTALTYVIPRLETVVCGGTAEPGAEDLRPDERTAARILARARELVPALRNAPVLDHLVGLRPARAAVRLEVETTANGPVVHCYGHGGAGVTLSWGCADEVAALVSRGRAGPASAG